MKCPIDATWALWLPDGLGELIFHTGGRGHFIFRRVYRTETMCASVATVLDRLSDFSAPESHASYDRQTTVQWYQHK
jgi:hypothetical protein